MEDPSGWIHTTHLCVGGLSGFLGVNLRGSGGITLRFASNSNRTRTLCTLPMPRGALFAATGAEIPFLWKAGWKSGKKPKKGHPNWDGRETPPQLSAPPPHYQAVASVRPASGSGCLSLEVCLAALHGKSSCIGKTSLPIFFYTPPPHKVISPGAPSRSNPAPPGFPLPSPRPRSPLFNSSPAKDATTGDSSRPRVSGLQSTSERRGQNPCREKAGGGEETQRRKEDREERLVSACPLLAVGDSAASVQSAKKTIHICVYVCFSSW